MTDEQRPQQAGGRREGVIATLVVALIVLFRSAAFVLWEETRFDADEAIIGLMAKHLAEGRALPVFYYGQTYMLGVEAWLTAPVFLIAGVSVATLRLPIVAINVAIALLMLRIFTREVGLRPALAAVPTLFFAMAAPGTASQLLAANGGNVEPALYILLIWLTRHRPLWCGGLLGLGFLQREFTSYGAVALLALEAARGTLFTRAGLVRRGKMLGTAAIVWIAVQWLATQSSAAGPDTTPANLAMDRHNVAVLFDRVCRDWDAIRSGAGLIVTQHWSTLFGTTVLPMREFGVESTHAQGLSGGWAILAAAFLLAFGAITWRLISERRWRVEYDAPAYLVLVALCSMAGYTVGRCGQINHLVLRYELLSLIGAAGVGAWFLRVAPALTRAAWIAAVCAWALIPATANARLLAEAAAHRRPGPKRQLARHLEARGIRYAMADYWLAYSLTFLTDERVIIASTDLVRVREYENQVKAHAAEAVHISRVPCEGGRRVEGVYFCPLTLR